MTEFELTLRRIISSFFSDIAGDNDINVDVFNANISLETQQITKLVADTVLKAIGENEIVPTIRLKADVAEILGKVQSASEGRNQLRLEIKAKVFAELDIKEK